MERTKKTKKQIAKKLNTERDDDAPQTSNHQNTFTNKVSHDNSTGRKRRTSILKEVTTRCKSITCVKRRPQHRESLTQKVPRAERKVDE